MTAMKTGSILLVAVGGIGFRHFQALLNCQSDFELHVVDTSIDAVNRARTYAGEQQSRKQIHYYHAVSELKPAMHFQIAIIATSSLVRRAIFEELITHCKVQTVIFEKVLFPELKDYEEVGELLQKNSISAYVNCARRVQDIYQELCKETRHSKWLHAQIVGADWGMACNAIHMVDLFAYLSSAAVEHITCSGVLLENQIYDSKRKGYIEFYGKLIGKIGEKTTYRIECSHGKAAPTIELFTEKAYYCINEADGCITKQALESGEFEEKYFRLTYVSQTTTQVVEMLLRKQPVELTSYEESAKLHIPVFKEFLKRRNQILGREEEICPIT